MASKEYLLSKYGGAPGDDDHDDSKKKKKKKRPPKAPAGATVGIVDDDVEDWKNARVKATESDLEELYGDAITKNDGRGGSESDEEKPKFKRFDEAGWETVRKGEAGSGSDDEERAERGRKRRHDSDDDMEDVGRVKRESLSPAARRRRHDSDSEDGGRGGSPPRRRRHDSRSVSRERSRSPARRRHDSRSPSRSVSPPRRRHDSRSPSPKREPAPTGPRMADGSAAGLQRAADLRREAEVRRADQMKRLAAFSTEESGRNASTIYRDKSGRKVDMAARRAEEAAEQRKREAEEEAKMEWGKGLVQQREKQESAASYAREAAKPLARYADDREMNEEMMDRDRWGDPMAGKVSKKKKASRPLYQGPPPPPNRFGILPGYRWDGVQRDNGFEQKLFAGRNEKISRAESAYRWSAEDM